MMTSFSTSYLLGRLAFGMACMYLSRTMRNLMGGLHLTFDFIVSKHSGLIACTPILRIETSNANRSSQTFM